MYKGCLCIYEKFGNVHMHKKQIFLLAFVYFLFYFEFGDLIQRSCLAYLYGQIGKVVYFLNIFSVSY